MDKRDFLKTSGAFITGSVLSRLVSAELPETSRTNWSGNYQYKASQLLVPEDVTELQQMVRKSHKLKALGARHSFNGIADSEQTQISLRQLDQMVLDRKSRTVTAGAGVTYGRLAPYLYENGFALHNLASLPHVSVVGACATATHGSGSENGNLSTAVSGIELVTADGEIVTLTREHDGDRFLGAVVGLGGLGIISKITLDVLPAFEVRQVVYESLPFSALEKNLDEIFSSGYSVSLFTDWRNHRATQVWIKRRADQPGADQPSKEFFGATIATRKLHPLAGHSAENCTEQMNIAGPWHERLPHFRMNFMPSSGAELQSEYFVARDRAYHAIRAVEKLQDDVQPHLFITELRTIHADKLWMSPCHHRESLAIHFTWKPEWPAVKKLLPMIEETLAPYDPRPHWAKLFTMPPAQLQSRYEKLRDFKNLLKHYDPQGKFRNDYLNAHLFAS